MISSQYDIVGHSGDGCDIELVPADKTPKNDKQRLKVLKVQTPISQTVRGNLDGFIISQISSLTVSLRSCRPCTPTLSSA